MRLFRKKLGQNEKLIRNINRLNEKEKAKQQESKVLGQKLAKGTTNKEKSINVWAKRRKSICNLVWIEIDKIETQCYFL